MYHLGIQDLVDAEWTRELYVVSQQFPTEDSLRKLLLTAKEVNAPDSGKIGEPPLLVPTSEGIDPVGCIRITFEGQDPAERIAELKARALQRTDYTVHVTDRGEITDEELTVLEKFVKCIYRLT